MPFTHKTRARFEYVQSSFPSEETILNVQVETQKNKIQKIYYSHKIRISYEKDSVYMILTGSLNGILPARQTSRQYCAEQEKSSSIIMARIVFMTNPISPLKSTKATKSTQEPPLVSKFFLVKKKKSFMFTPVLFSR